MYPHELITSSPVKYPLAGTPAAILAGKARGDGPSVSTRMAACVSRKLTSQNSVSLAAQERRDIVTGCGSADAGTGTNIAANAATAPATGSCRLFDTAAAAATDDRRYDSAVPVVITIV